MGFLRKKNKDDDFIMETNDLLIVFDHEQRTSDIRRVSSIENGAIIVTGLYKVPLLDCEITTGLEGRNFFYRAPSQSIMETERLAQLEVNEVLTQITAYKQPVPASSLDWMKGLLIGLLFVSLIVQAF